MGKTNKIKERLQVHSGWVGVLSLARFVVLSLARFWGGRGGRNVVRAKRSVWLRVFSSLSLIKGGGRGSVGREERRKRKEKEKKGGGKKRGERLHRKKK